MNHVAFIVVLIVIILAIPSFFFTRKMMSLFRTSMIKGVTPDGRTIINRCVVGPVLLCLGVLFIWFAVHGEQVGHIYSRAGTIYETKDFVSFWFQDLLDATLGLIMLVTGAFTIQKAIIERKCLGLGGKSRSMKSRSIKSNDHLK